MLDQNLSTVNRTTDLINSKNREEIIIQVDKRKPRIGQCYLGGRPTVVLSVSQTGHTVCEIRPVLQLPGDLLPVEENICSVPVRNNVETSRSCFRARSGNCNKLNEIGEYIFILHWQLLTMNTHLKALWWRRRSQAATIPCFLSLLKKTGDKFWLCILCGGIWDLWCWSCMTFLLVLSICFVFSGKNNKM